MTGAFCLQLWNQRSPTSLLTTSSPLVHATTDAPTTYTCVSYVWGPSDVKEWITVDNQPFRVRHNLWEFLRFAQLAPTTTWYWIDALSIDQANSGEKNHQVQQMGQIFSQAAKVIAWLGPNEEVATYLQKIRDNDDSDQSSLRRGRDAVIKLRYWDRAWIVQEVCLAHTVTLMSCNESLPMQRLPWKYYIELYRNGWYPRDSMHRLLRFQQEQIENERTKDLVHLIWIYRGSECSVPRDRIFSLLSLCKEASNLVVDYNMPLEALAINTLRACKSTFCFCTAHIVGDALGLGDAFSAPHTEEDAPFARLMLPVRAEFSSNNGPGRKFVPIGPGPSRKRHVAVERSRFHPYLKEESMHVTFRLDDMCPSYAYGSTRDIHIMTYRDRPGFFYGHDGTVPSWFRKKGAQLELSNDKQHWVLTFTLKFLLEITRQSEWHGRLSHMINIPSPCSDDPRWRQGETQALQLL